MAQGYRSQLARENPISSNKGQIFQSLASRLSAFSNEQQNELDREMIKKGKEAGRTDAQGKTSIVLRDGNTLADDAWNEGAMVSHVSAVKLSMTENLTRIASENPKNPEGYHEQAKGFASGMLEGVPEKLRPMLQDEISTAMLKTKMKLDADLKSFEREKHLANTSEGIDLYRTEGENAAKEGDQVGAQDALTKALFLTDSLEKSGLLSPGAAKTQRRDIVRDVEDQAIYGAFGRELADGAGLQYIKRFNSLKSLGDRDPEYRKKMSQTMVAMIGKSHAIEAAARKKDDDERKDRWRLGEQEIVSLDLEAKLTPEHLKQLVKEDRLDPAIAGKYKKNAMSEAPEFSDGSLKNSIRADLLEFTEFELLTHPDLSMADREKFVLEHRKLSEDAGNWRRTQNGTEGARRINQAFGIIKGVDTRITEDKARRAGQVMTRFFQETENLPLEEREYKAVEIADRLVKEVNGEIVVEDLEKAHTRLEKAPYQTMDQIEKADLGTEEKKVQIKQLQRKLDRIQRLERSIGK